MTAIGDVGSSSATTRTTTTRDDPMQAVTDLLGGDKRAIFRELRKGKSLDDIAKDKGVSHDDLTAAIAKGMPADATDATAEAEQIAATQGLSQGGPHGGPQGPPPGGHPHGPPPTGSTGALGSRTISSTQDRLDTLSSLLGTDSTTLVSQLMSGTSLASLATSKGVTSSQITDALQKGDLFDSYA